MRNRDERSGTKRISSANRRRFLLAAAGVVLLGLRGRVEEFVPADIGS